MAKVKANKPLVLGSQNWTIPVYGAGATKCVLLVDVMAVLSSITTLAPNALEGLEIDSTWARGTAQPCVMLNDLVATLTATGGHASLVAALNTL